MPGTSDQHTSDGHAAGAEWSLVTLALPTYVCLAGISGAPPGEQGGVSSAMTQAFHTALRQHRTTWGDTGDSIHRVAGLTSETSHLAYPPRHSTSGSADCVGNDTSQD